MQLNSIAKICALLKKIFKKYSISGAKDYSSMKWEVRLEIEVVKY